MSRALRFAPLALLFLVIAALVWRLATPADTDVHSRMVNKPVPAFSLPAALPRKPGLSSADLATGNPRLVNVFASWCIPCAAEAPQLMQLAKAGVPIDAIAIRDRPDDIADFLKRYGNPYRHIGGDTASTVQIALGSSGVPETFVIDGKGIIRHQHIGDIRAEDVDGIVQAVEAAR